MADITITFKIPQEKAKKALEGFLKIYPNNETIPDPNFDGEGEAPLIPKYSDKEWVVEKIRRIIARDIKRGLEMIRNEQITKVEDTNDMIKNEK